MENHLVTTLTKKHCKPFNEAICNGLARIHLQDPEGYLDQGIRCAAVDFPPGLTYDGCVRCLPTEAFRVQCRRIGTNKSLYELSRSDIYLVKFLFSYNGVVIPDQFLFMPAVRQAGLITINGATFSVSPVVTDRGFSIGDNDIFIKLGRDRTTYRRQQHQFMANDAYESPDVVWSNIHHDYVKVPKSARNVQMNCALAHFLFCKYGLQETFRKMLGVEIEVGDSNNINHRTHPPEEWVVCRTCEGVKPSGVKGPYVHTDVRLAVPKHAFTETVRSLVAGFFYVADRFTDRMYPEYLSDPIHWRRLMGLIIYGNGESEGALLNNMARHIASIDGYVDNMVRENLKAVGVDITDSYDLFLHIIETFAQRITEGAKEVASMFGKQLSVTSYVLGDLLQGINRMMFALQGAAKQKTLSHRDVEKIISKYFKPTAIIKINNDHPEVSSVSSPSDCMAFKITANMVLQSSMGGGRRRAVTMGDPSKKLHASIAVVGQYNNLPKGEPTGRTRANPRMKLATDGATIIRDPDTAEIIDKTQRIISQ